MSASPILLAEGGVDDLDAVMRVMNDSFDPAFGERWTGSQCAGLLPMPGVWLSLALSGDEVVGFALARIVLREAELLLLAVARPWQHRGVGRLLLDRFTRIAQGRGAASLFLEVRDGNPAIRLYEGRGFVEVGRRSKYYTGSDGRKYDAVTLMKKIAT